MEPEDVNAGPTGAEGYSIGVGITSACNMRCRHCYSGSGKYPAFMSPGELFRLLDSVAVEAVNLGTGESALHPEFESVVEGILSREIDLAITSNGYSIEQMSDELLSRLHDVDLSLDFPDAARHDEWRATGSFEQVLRAVERCRRLGVVTSIAMCLMKQNCRTIPEMIALCAELGVSLRINLYKPVSRTEYMPSYRELWDAVRIMFESGCVASCSEPIILAALRENGFTVRGCGSPCGTRSFRVSPSGEILPCVYWGDTGIFLNDLLDEGADPGTTLRALLTGPAPDECRDCPHLKVCQGGCLGRRYHTGLGSRDVYCFVDPDRQTPLLDRGIRASSCGGWVHASYLCTMIVDPLAGSGESATVDQEEGS